MELVSRISIPERRVAISKDVLAKVSGTATGAPKLALPQVVIVPAPTSLPRPEDPELIALRQIAQAARAHDMSIEQYRRSLASQQRVQSQPRPKVGARPRTPSPPEPTPTPKQRMLARKYRITDQEVLDAKRRAKIVGMTTVEFLDQMSTAEQNRPTRTRREVVPVERLVDVQQRYFSGMFHGRRDGWDRRYDGPSRK